MYATVFLHFIRLDGFGIGIRTYIFTARALVSLVSCSVSKIVSQINVGFAVCLVCVYKFCCSMY